jgi:serine/threonine-protein kinase
MGQMLRHPNIVAIYDVGEEAGTSYITMEFVEGQTLRELVKRRGALDIPKAFDLIHQMASGLEYAHRRGVTHRDLKASNVIVSSTGHVKLVDFGLAGVDESDGTLEKLSQPRTVDYAALEKLTGMKDDAVRSDIYFLGAIAYLTITGVSPLKETRDRNERSDPRRYTGVVPIKDQKPDLPRDVIDFINRAMALDAMERLQTATDVKRRAEAILVRVTGGEAADSVVLSSIIAYKGSLMLVESSERCQDKLRDFFTRLGYKVLLTESPQRALSRFSTVPRPADMLVLSTHKLGEEAVKAFNMISTTPDLADVPAILLADSKQGNFAGLTRVDDRRRFVLMPIHAEGMSKLFAELMGAARAAAGGSQVLGGSQVIGGSSVIGGSQLR